MGYEDVFEDMVGEFKANKNKETLIEIMTEYCEKGSTTPKEIYELKKKIELTFAKSVDCTYCYLKTPTNYGCDLREIFYDRDDKLIKGGKELLELFNSKKLPYMWHIMTDIDDTLYPNTEHSTYIAGSDTSWNQKEPYPGIELFFKLLYKTPEVSKYSTILSATPGCLKTSKLKDKHGLLHKIIGDFGFIQGIESKGKIALHLLDIISNCVGKYCFVKAINKTTNKDNISSLFTLFGNTKFERFKQYISLFPEYKILFIGDNGQGDVLAGAQMIEHSPSCHVFIHKVSEDGKNFKKSEEEDIQNSQLHFFKNYYELAKQLKDLGIMDSANVNSIKDEINETVSKTKYKDLYVLDDGLLLSASSGKLKTSRTPKTTKKSTTIRKPNKGKTKSLRFKSNFRITSKYPRK